MRVIVSGGNRDRCFIVNMDQTPVYFSMSSKQTSVVIGKKTIHICTSANDTKHVTVVVTITADSTLLPFTLVFKGKPKGKIATKGVPIWCLPSNPLLQVPGSCLDGRGGDDRVSE
jgi:hypothetical protein